MSTQSSIHAARDPTRWRLLALVFHCLSYCHFEYPRIVYALLSHSQCCTAHATSYTARFNTKVEREARNARGCFVLVGSSLCWWSSLCWSFSLDFSTKPTALAATHYSPFVHATCRRPRPPTGIDKLWSGTVRVPLGPMQSTNKTTDGRPKDLTIATTI